MSAREHGGGDIADEFERDAYLGEPVFDAAEACHLAQNLARNAGWHVFPCHVSDKSPATPHGFKDATADPDRIADLWRRFPGELVGIATGTISGIAVLDIDIKHPEACAWWHANKHRVPETRAYRTRGGGAHFYFRHRKGIRSKQAACDVPGLDTRGDGGYVIHWFAYGLPCINHAPPAEWPDWLFTAIWPPPKPRTDPAQRKTTADNAIDAIIRTVAVAREGSRNGMLYWAANRLRERGIRQTEAQNLLRHAAAECGLAKAEAAKTIASAWRAGR